VRERERRTVDSDAVEEEDEGGCDRRREVVERTKKRVRGVSKGAERKEKE
jgi:hypothetical protein